MKNFTFSLVVSYLLILSSTSMAQSGGSGKKDFTLSVQTSLVIEKFDSTPDGFSSGDLKPPPLSVEGLMRQTHNSLFGSYYKIYGGFVAGTVPMFGLGAGVFFSLPIVELHLGGVFRAHDYINKTPYKDSQFAYSGYGFEAGARFDLTLVEFGANFTYMDLGEANLANYEELTTKIDHNPDYIYSAFVQSALGLFKVKAAYTHYIFGSTGIASKEFAIHLPKAELNKIAVGVGVSLSAMEVWARVEQVEDPKDESSHFYQSPHFYPDYLLGKRTGFVEVKWSF